MNRFPDSHGSQFPFVRLCNFDPTARTPRFINPGRERSDRNSPTAVTGRKLASNGKPDILPFVPRLKTPGKRSGIGDRLWASFVHVLNHAQTSAFAGAETESSTPGRLNHFRLSAPRTGHFNATLDTHNRIISQIYSLGSGTVGRVQEKRMTNLQKVLV